MNNQILRGSCLKLGLRALTISAGIGALACSGTGERGETGPMGQTGREGAEGEVGAIGAIGEAGEPGQQGATGADLRTPSIEFEGESVFPEGIALGNEGEYYVSSFLHGDIYRVAPDSLDPELFSEGVLQNAAGLLVSDDVLYACDNYLTTGFDNAAAVVGLSLETGEEISRHEFEAGPDVCNDITLDGQGNLYATASFSNAIYRILAEDLALNTAAEKWDDRELYGVNYTAGNFGLNGIAFDGKETLFAVSHFTGELFQVEIADDGTAGELLAVSLSTAAGDERPLMMPDGLEWSGTDSLMVAEQGGEWLARIDLSSKRVLPVAGGLDNPATFVFDAEGDAWVVNSQLNDFAGGTAPTLPFTVVEVPLD